MSDSCGPMLILWYSIIMSNKPWLDRVGACASAVCAVHCVLTGIALGLLSSLGLGFFGNIWVDVAFVGTAVVVGGLALWHGIKRHGSPIPALFYVGGLISLIVAHFKDFSHGWPVHTEHQHGPVTTILSIVGGACFVLFHILNLRLQHNHTSNCSCTIAAKPEGTLSPEL